MARLMLQAIADRTVAFNIPPGRFDAFARTTADALASGAAHEIAPHLTAPLEVVDNLVLEGVLALAAGEYEGSQA